MSVLIPSWVLEPTAKTIVVGVAEMVASNDTEASLVTYSLGSCLGVAVFDPVRHAGALLHAMLPDSAIDPVKRAEQPDMFVDTGLPRLFRAVYALGGERSRLTVRMAGGAQFMDEGKVFNIGMRNIEQARSLLARNGFRIHAEDTGGQTSRTLRLNLANGQFTVHSPGVAPYSL